MCGLAGSYQQADGRDLVSVMIARLEHRGPDAEGLYECDAGGAHVVLAHRRLSIIDLSTEADQPYRKDGLALVFNGEIYNYRELRQELQAGGTRFHTQSDTEVLLECWRKWGTDSLVRLRGMFAFALLDETTGSIFLARDPFGIKPLYVYRRGAGVLFASELKAIVAAAAPELRVNSTAMVASMLYYWLPPSRTPVTGVEKLESGTWTEFSADGTTRRGLYWSTPDEAAAAVESSPGDLGRTIVDSVEAHLVADVPVHTFLSGGLDSSLITAIAARRNSGTEAYTIAFRPEDHRLEAMPPDAHYARLVAKSLGIKLHEIPLTPDVVRLLPKMVEMLDEPIGDPAAINTLLMCEAARASGVKVLLSGMGADELFGGYRKHLACLLGARYQRLPKIMRRQFIGPLVNRMPVIAKGRGIRTVRWAQRFVTFADLPEQEAFRRSYTMYDPADLVQLLGEDLRPGVADLIEEHDAIYEDNHLADQVSRMCLADTRLFMPGLNLTYTDRASMAASAEVRVPFVDKEVFRAAFSLPGSAKIDGRTQKAPLKRAARSWLPDEVIYRPKGSFGAPLRAWVTVDLRELIDDVLLGGELVQNGVLHREGVARLVTEQRSGRSDQSKQVWQMLTLELWYRHMHSAGVRLA